MKKYIFNILFFFSIVAFCDIAFGLLCKYMTKKSHGDIACLASILDKHYNVIVMGSSRCVSHYDDKLMGDFLRRDVLNAGESGNGIILMYGRYHVIPRDIKPQVLIYDVEPSFDVNVYENDDGHRRYLEGLKPFYNEEGIKDIFKDVDELEMLKMLSQFYRYNSALFSIMHDYFLHSNSKNSRYQPLYKVYSESGIGTQKKRDFDTFKLRYFEKLILDCKKNKTQLVVVASPKYCAISKRDLQPLIEICLQNDVPFWDYYYEMHETRWFGDNMHLNYQGSQEFTKIICKRLQEEIFK